MNKYILELQSISKTFIIAKQPVEVLRGVDLKVSNGEAIAIMGPSGAGKTTLLNIAGGLMRPSGGSAKIDGHELFNQNDEGLSRSRNQLVGFVFQLHHLLPEFTAEENVMMPALLAKTPRASASQRARELLEQVGLKHRVRHRPGELSGGEQQRVAIARALMNRPKIILADEPTGDLDGKTAAEIHELFKQLNREQQQTLILVTHNPELGKIAGRMITMKDGVIASEKGAK